MILSKLGILEGAINFPVFWDKNYLKFLTISENPPISEITPLKNFHFNFAVELPWQDQDGPQIESETFSLIGKFPWPIKKEIEFLERFYFEFK